MQTIAMIFSLSSYTSHSPSSPSSSNPSYLSNKLSKRARLRAISRLDERRPPLPPKPLVPWPSTSSALSSSSTSGLVTASSAAFGSGSGGGSGSRLGAGLASVFGCGRAGSRAVPRRLAQCTLLASLSSRGASFINDEGGALRDAESIRTATPSRRHAASRGPWGRRTAAVVCAPETGALCLRLTALLFCMSTARSSGGAM